MISMIPAVITSSGDEMAVPIDEYERLLNKISPWVLLKVGEGGERTNRYRGAGIGDDTSTNTSTAAQRDSGLSSNALLNKVAALRDIISKQENNAE